MRKKWYKRVLRHRMIVVLLIILQALVLVALVQSGIRKYAFLAPFLGLVSGVVVLYIIGRQDTAGYKLTWTVLILLFPVFGGLLYVLYRLQSLKLQNTTKAEKFRPFYQMPGSALDEAVREMPFCSTQLSSLQQFSGYPVYDRTRTTYFPSGEEKFRALLKDLEKAKKYIFLEYFIIQEGEMWNSILRILEDKAARGVEVRLIYDDMGCFLLLPPRYKKMLEEKGIKCVVFNPLTPFLTALHNNRDHRKIAVIDGTVAYTGGVNLADEYINRVERFGHWRDAAIRLEGAAAWSLTVIFLQMWSLCTKSEENIARYYPFSETPPAAADGYVQPYADSPLDIDNVGERTYMQMITGAKKYLYISTPYLIIDDSMLSALVTAARSGVDVRILTPEKWDKRLVHLTTRSYYRALLRGGVKIYEYSGGFNHAKTFVSDDTVATVGTVNLDFRSLYLHFECGVKLYKTESVAEIRKDFLYTVSRSEEIVEKNLKNGTFVRTVQSILRLFAPLM